MFCNHLMKQQHTNFMSVLNTSPAGAIRSLVFLILFPVQGSLVGTIKHLSENQQPGPWQGIKASQLACPHTNVPHIASNVLPTFGSAKLLFTMIS